MNSLKLADDVGHYFVSADVAVGPFELLRLVARLEKFHEGCIQGFLFTGSSHNLRPNERIEVVRCFGDIVCSDFIVDVVGEQGIRVEQLRGLFW